MAQLLLCRGQIDVMRHLSHQSQLAGPGLHVLFLTPCHATPYYSHLHQPIPMQFLDCSPSGGAAFHAGMHMLVQSLVPAPCVSLLQGGVTQWHT